MAAAAPVGSASRYETASEQASQQAAHKQPGKAIKGPASPLTAQTIVADAPSSKAVKNVSDAPTPTGPRVQLPPAEGAYSPPSLCISPPVFLQGPPAPSPAQQHSKQKPQDTPHGHTNAVVRMAVPRSNGVVLYNPRAPAAAAQPAVPDAQDTAQGPSPHEEQALADTAMEPSGPKSTKGRGTASASAQDETKKPATG